MMISMVKLFGISKIQQIKKGNVNLSFQPRNKQAKNCFDEGKASIL